MNRQMGWELQPGFEQDADGGMTATWPTEGGAISTPVESPLTPEPQAPVENGSQGHQRSQEEHQGNGQGAPNGTGNVPYQRFQQTNAQKNDLAAQLQAQGATIQQLQGLVQALMGEGGEGGKPPVGPSDETADEKKARLAEFYRDPKAYADNIKRDLEKKFSGQFKEVQESFGYELDKRLIRQMHGDNSEVEQKMVDAIQTLGLKRLGPQNAVRAAYRMVTGRDLPASMAQVQANGVRNRTQAPNQGGGENGDAMTAETFRQMPLAEFAKNPQEYARRMIAAATTTP